MFSLEYVNTYNKVNLIRINILTCDTIFYQRNSQMSIKNISIGHLISPIFSFKSSKYEFDPSEVHDDDIGFIIIIKFHHFNSILCF